MTSELTFRVRYAETDKFGVAHHSVHYVWFEMGRVQYLRDIGLDYNELEDLGIGMIVAESNCKYKAPVYFDDLLTLKTTVSKVKRKIVKFDYKLFTPDKDPAATGSTTHIPLKDGKVVKLPSEYFKPLKNA